MANRTSTTTEPLELTRMIRLRSGEPTARATSTPLTLVLTLAGAIFTGELLVMLLLMVYPVDSPLREALLDATVLLLFVSPALYWLLYRPLNKRIRQLQESNDNIRRLSSALLRAREDEQRRLALDLHDELGQALSALQFDMENLQERLAPDETDLSPRCSRMIRQVQQLGTQVRSITQTLRPTILDDLGIVPALDWLVASVREQWPDISFSFSATGLQRRPPAEVETAFFRICQEALTNVFRHAEASSVAIRLVASYPNLVLTVRDDGCGFDPAERTRGNPWHLGLLGMRERALSLDGELSIQSSPGGGTLIRVRIPVEASLGTD